jgi:hypothetical protein
MKWLDRALVVLPQFYGLCLNEKDFRRELKSLKVPRADWPPFLCSEHAHATLHTFTKGDGGLCAIVTLADTSGRSIAQVHAMLVHEAVHLWQEARSIIGEKSPSSEFEAYAVQSISQRLMEAYEELRPKTKKAKKK